MLPAREIRLWNARYLAEQEGGIADLASKIDRSASQLGQVIGLNPTKGIGNRLARLIEQMTGQPEHWLDSPHRDLWNSIQRDDWRAQLPPAETAHYAVREEADYCYQIGSEEARYIRLYEALNDDQKKAVIRLLEVMSNNR